MGRAVRQMASLVSSVCVSHPGVVHFCYPPRQMGMHTKIQHRRLKTNISVQRRQRGGAGVACGEGRPASWLCEQVLATDPFLLWDGKKASEQGPP